MAKEKLVFRSVKKAKNKTSSFAMTARSGLLPITECAWRSRTTIKKDISLRRSTANSNKMARYPPTSFGNGLNLGRENILMWKQDIEWQQCFWSLNNPLPKGLMAKMRESNGTNVSPLTLGLTPVFQGVLTLQMRVKVWERYFMSHKMEQSRFDIT